MRSADVAMRGGSVRPLVAPPQEDRMPRAKAIVIRVDDRPGTLGEITSALGEKKVNLRAVHGSNVDGHGVVRLVVDKLGVAKKILSARGWRPREEQILQVDLADHPGALGEVAKLLGDARVNIRYVFASAGGGRKATAFLAVSDLDAALSALR
jgi:hypothetical protein